jgi:transposase InsO family protein
VKYGYFKNIRRWWCKDCRRKFADNNAMPRMKTAINQVGAALIAYYEGVPLIRIRQEIIRKYGIYVSYSTLFNWIDNLSRSASHEARYCHLEVSETWAVIESKVKIKNKDYTSIDILDHATQFLLSAVISDNINEDVISDLLDSARERTLKLPRKIIILGSRELQSIIAGHYSSRDKNIQIILYSEKALKFEELNKPFFYKRNVVLSRLRKKEHLPIIMDGWVVHYNYFRRHELLGGQTPAEKAGVSITTPN